jgi:hypothetical protein
MEVEYTLEVDDALAFYHYHRAYGPTHHRPSAVRWRGLVVLSVLIAVLMGMEIWFFREISSLTMILLGSLLFLVMFTVFLQRAQPGIIERRLRRLFRGSEGKGAFRPKRLTISPDGLTTVSDYTSTILLWPASEKVAATEAHVFFYTSPTDAVIVPKRAFADEWRFTEFVDQARRYHEAAQKTDD